MDHSVEIFGQPMSEIKRRATVYADRTFDLHDGDLVTTNPSRDVARDLVRIVTPPIPNCRPNSLTDRRLDPKYPRGILLRDPLRGVEFGGVVGD